MPEATEAMAFTDSYKHMECLVGTRLQNFLTLFTRATLGTPASILIKQVIVYLSVRSPMAGQTTRPNGLKFVLLASKSSKMSK